MLPNGRMENGRYADFSTENFFDPKTTGDGIKAVWTDPPSDPYRIIDDGKDFWLAAGEPKCADCHNPPFVENMGGIYEPIDQVEKFSLMRYSKGHRGISCQSCHQSAHGLYPVTEKGADPVSLSQAKAINPDGQAGPIKCGTCHVVDSEGVPTMVADAMLQPYPKEIYPTRYEQATALMHSLRTYEEVHGPGKLGILIQPFIFVVQIYCYNFLFIIIDTTNKSVYI